MKRIIALAALGTSLMFSGSAFAVEQTLTLAVANMTCVSCPYIVEKSLTAVPGVTKVAVSFEKKTADVTFDDRTTTVDALIAVTTKAGYPTKLAAATKTKTQ